MFLRYGKRKNFVLFFYVMELNPRLLLQVFRSFFVLGRLGGFNSMNMQVGYVIISFVNLPPVPVLSHSTSVRSLYLGDFAVES
jgi:hypothetical protein